ncbi:uncharacterized protein Dwil_GK23592 [Drosophila willistoni]|uniref:Uncharacterized protein n=1 Tax=Drosophila willistoni TaxID=7260 RepID=B4N741_DROWI|nr:uncharacterized protein Dwil_GK23592 [Drosophila willistoni]
MVNLLQVSFTNFKCSTKDKSYADFEICRIKAVNRTHKYVDLHVRLHKLPIDNVTIHLRFMRYDGQGYKVYFVDSTFDACKFLKNPTKNPLVRIFYESYRKYSNVNHTCPYNHDIIINKLWTSGLYDRYLDLISYLPVASGDYALFTDWYSQNHDAIVDKLWSGDLESDFTRYISMAYGEFGIFTEWYVLNRHECTVNVSNSYQQQQQQQHQAPSTTATTTTTTSDPPVWTTMSWTTTVCGRPRLSKTRNLFVGKS